MEFDFCSQNVLPGSCTVFTGNTAFIGITVFTVFTAFTLTFLPAKSNKNH